MRHLLQIMKAAPSALLNRATGWTSAEHHNLAGVEELPVVVIPTPESPTALRRSCCLHYVDRETGVLGWGGCPADAEGGFIGR